MNDRVTKFALFAAYQTTLVLGIAFVPVAILARKMGITVPMHRLIERTEKAYRSAA